MDIQQLCISCFSENEDGDFCGNCGFQSGNYVNSPHHLPGKTILAGRYLVGKVLGEGGFGITYIGYDLNLRIKVAIKEYYPNGCVTRESTNTKTVYPYTGEKGEFFERGKVKFLDEARTLAKFSNYPGIVSVRDFFMENQTAYIVMEYIEGETIKSYLEKNGGKISSENMFRLMLPVMQSLGKIHQVGVIHRDISPDNIMIDSIGQIKLLDFGAARDFIGSGNKSLSVMLKPGYAPEEQYRSRGVQGPWTDVYALCATIYRCITGEVPIESNERVWEDTLKPPSECGALIKEYQEKALMKGLEVAQKNRYQDVLELVADLYPTEEALNQQVQDKVQKIQVEEVEIAEEPIKVEPVIEAPVYQQPTPVVSQPNEKKNGGWKKFAAIACIGMILLLVLFGRGTLYLRESDTAPADWTSESMMETTEDATTDSTSESMTDTTTDSTSNTATDVLDSADVEGVSVAILYSGSDSSEIQDVIYYAEALGVDYSVSCAENDITTQIALLEIISMSAGADCILVYPVSGDIDAYGSLSNAEAYGIPVVVLGTEMDATSSVVSSDWQAGYDAGLALAETLSDTPQESYTIGEIYTTSLEIEWEIERIEGFEQAITESLGNNVEFVCIDHSGWDYNITVDKLQVSLAAYDISAIFSASNASIPAVAQAMDATALDTIVVSVYDVTNDSAYSDGVDIMMVPEEDLGIVGLETLLNAAIGESVDSLIEVPYIAVSGDDL